MDLSLMQVLKYLFSCLYRVWFYILMILTVVLLAPFLIFTIWSDKTYPAFFALARIWAKLTFYGMGMRVKVLQKQTLKKGESYVFIANHTSMLDIMLMLILVKDNPFVFVGKEELAKIPIFGFFYKKTCILVNRGDAKSRFHVFESAQKRLQEGLSICIFPEGGVPDDLNIILDKFKDGAFRIAVDHQIAIAPMSFGKLKYFFPFNWGKGYPGVVPVIQHPIISTKNKTAADRKALKEEAYQMILDPLAQWEKEECK